MMHNTYTRRTRTDDRVDESACVWECSISRDIFKFDVGRTAVWKER